MKFGIVGYGYVGRATHTGIIKNQKCVVHDILFNTSLADLKDCTDIFFCIPTGTQEDVETLTKEIKKLDRINPDCNIIIRSTLPLYSCEQIELRTNRKIIYIPEFLRERNWEADCIRRPLVIGHNNLKLPRWITDDQTVECTTREAELIKMFSNNYAVIRIAFANLFYDLSKASNSNYNLIKDTFLKLKHDQEYLDMPGHDGSRGFGGKCLPKDLDFLISTVEKEELNINWLKEIRELNKEWQKRF